MLENDKRAHELMAELEALLYQQVPVDFNRVEVQYKRFSAALERVDPQGRNFTPHGCR